MSEITAYMERQGFGNYENADVATRDEMEMGALEFAANEQTRPSIFAEIGAESAKKRYDEDNATKDDIKTLRALDAITVEDAEGYYHAHGWTLPKYGIR